MSTYSILYVVTLVRGNDIMGYGYEINARGVGHSVYLYTWYNTVCQNVMTAVSQPFTAVNNALV